MSARSGALWVVGWVVDGGWCVVEANRMCAWRIAAPCLLTPAARRTPTPIGHHTQRAATTNTPDAPSIPRARPRSHREAELARLSGTAAPQTPADFERLVLASPNSSFVWIKYMAHHIGLGDMDAARKVAQRALDSINYR